MTDIKHHKREVFAIGETVLDLVSQPAQSNRTVAEGFAFLAVPGGSVLNASVSLGRMGIEVYLVSEFGADIAGNIIDEFLRNNAVDTSFTIRHHENNTSLALAFLDFARNATYSFYHDTPEKLEEINIPAFRKDDVLLFGSFYAVKPNRRDYLHNILLAAAEAGALIYYDLNIRKSHTGNMDLLMPSFLNNIAIANIVKGSDEDFYSLFGLSDPVAIYEKVSPYCKILIITNGSNPVQVFTPGHMKTYKVPEIIPVSTIGAGDNFNAGFIYGLATSEINSKNIAEMSESDLDRLSGCGLAFATEACLSAENYIKGNFKPDFWKKYI
jgi:fructokinase